MTVHITISPKTPTEKILEVLHALPQTLLQSLEISLDMDIEHRKLNDLWEPDFSISSQIGMP